LLTIVVVVKGDIAEHTSSPTEKVPRSHPADTSLRLLCWDLFSSELYCRVCRPFTYVCHLLYKRYLGEDFSQTLLHWHYVLWW